MATGTKSKIDMKYLKRTTELIGGATGEFFRDVMPTSWGIAKDVKSGINPAINAITSGTRSIVPKVRQLKNQIGIKSIGRWFLTKEGEYDEEETDSNIDFDIGDLDDSDIAEVQISESAKAANQVSKALVESSSKMFEANVQLSANIVNSIDKQTEVIESGFQGTIEAINNLLEVVTKNTSTLIEATVASNSDDESRYTKDVDLSEKMLGNMRFKASDYLKIVGKQADNELRNKLGMNAMILDLAKNGQLSQIFSPETITSLGLDLATDIFAPKLKENLEALDTSLNETVMSGLIRLGNNYSKGIGGTLSRIFGIDSRRRSVDTQRDDITTGTVQWNGIGQEALTNAIPGYLRKILVQLGGDDLVYDYRARRFIEHKEFVRQFREATTTIGALSSNERMGETILEASGDQGSLLYDLLINDLSSNYIGDDQHKEIEKLRDRTYLTAKVKSLLGEENLSNASPDEIENYAAFIKVLSRQLDSEDARNELSIQAANSEVARRNRGDKFVEEANLYNMDLSELEDNYEDSRKHILQNYIDEDDVVVKEGTQTSSETGSSYTNRALYEIYRRLDTGLNVYVVGQEKEEDQDQGEFLSLNALAPPVGYNPRRATVVAEDPPSEDNSTLLSTIVSGDDEEDNLLENNEQEDGTTEDLSKLDRFSRWGKKRGGQLKDALFSGSPKDVQKAFGAIVHDVVDVAGDEMKKGLAKVNENFGNVSGWLKHKMFGTEYSYKDADGKMHMIKENTGIDGKGGGLFGFVRAKVTGIFDKASTGAKKWINDVLGYFDKGDKDDDADSKTKANRKKLLFTSVGAFAGAGFLGGPLGLLAGALAGNALSVGGSALKNFLFGHDKDGKPTGFLSKMADKIISPIQFQVGKTVAFAGSSAKKHIFGPLSDLGRSIHDRVTNHVDTVMDKFKQKLYGGLAKIGGGLLKAGANIAGTVATIGQRASTTITGKAARGAIGIGGAMVGGLLTGMSKSIAGKGSFHKLSKDELYPLRVGDHYMDPNDANEIKELEDNFDDGIHKVRHTDKYPGGVVLLFGNREKEWMPLTKDYNKWRRKKRNEDIDKDLKNSGYYGKGGVFGFFGGDYKKWHEDRYSNRAKDKADLASSMAEEELIGNAIDDDVDIANDIEEVSNGNSNEDIDISNAIEEQTNKMDEHYSNQEEALSRITGEIIPGSSFKTHDEGVHKRLDRIIELLGGEPFEDDKVQPEGESDIPSESKTEDQVESTTEETVPVDESSEIVEAIKDSSDKSESEGFAESALSTAATVTAASGGGMDQEEVKATSDIADETAKDDSDKSSVASDLKKVFENQEKKQQEVEKEEKNKTTSFISTLFEGIGGTLVKFWPVALGGLLMLSDKFRKWFIDDALPAAGSWLKDNLPGILKGAWDLYQDASETITDESTGTETYHDEITDKDVKQMDSEVLHDKYENGLLNSAFEDATTLPSLGRNTLEQVGVSKLGGAVATLGSIPVHGASVGTRFINWATNKFSSNEALKGATSEVAKATGGAAAFGSGLVKGFSNPVGTILGITADTGSHIVTNYMESSRHQDMLGGYGLSDKSGAAQMGSTKLNNNLALASGAATQVGFAVAYAAATAGLVNGWNPVGWGLFIGSIVMVAMMGISAIINQIFYVINASSDRKYAVRSNSAKLGAVIGGKKYDYNQDSPFYVYCPTDSDRALGLNQGAFIKNPELRFGQFFKSIKTGMLASGNKATPGAEVLLYDLINNMAVQGVPFAVYAVEKDSKEADFKGNHANESYELEPIKTSNAKVFSGAKTQVKYKTVDTNSKTVMDDQNRNIAIYDRDACFEFDDVRDLYEVGKKVYDALLKHGILNSSGEVQTKKFKNAPGSSKNAEGWSALEKIGRENGVYFVQQCLIYINSKVDVDSKTGQQWIATNSNNIDELGKLLKDVAEGEAAATIANLKKSGLSDEDIAALMDPSSGEATESADIVPALELGSDQKDSVNSLTNNQKQNLGQYMRYLAASYMYSHPAVLQKWAEKHTDEVKKASIPVSDISSFSTWDSIKDKKLKESLESEMASLSERYAENLTNPDIFGIIPNINWYTVKNKAEIGSTADVNEQGWKDLANELIDTPEKSAMGKIWENGTAYQEDPVEMHKDLTGNKKHGSGAEVTSMKDFNAFSDVKNYGALGRLAYLASKFPSEGWKAKFAEDDASSNDWEEAIIASNFGDPQNLAIGGPSSDIDEDNPEFEDTSLVGENTSTNTQEGGNPLNKDYRVTSKFGPRSYPHSGTHKGVDLVPKDGSGEADVGTRYAGTVQSVKSDVSDSDHAYKNSSGSWYYPGNNATGNMVTIKTDDGKLIKNMHLAAGSIPSSIKPGARVDVGDKIGVMGTTGWSTGKHLHYQIEAPDGNPVDPMSEVEGGSTMGVFNTNSNDTYSSESTSDISAYISTSSTPDMNTDESSSGEGVLSQAVSILKSLGSNILNHLTGGLFGNSSSDDTATIVDGVSGAAPSTGGVYTSTTGYTITGETITNVDDFLKMVGAEIGTTEYPANSNKTKYGEWYGLNGEPWCMIFVQWCFNQAKLPIEHKTASCSDLYKWFCNNKPNAVWDAGKGMPKPGDVVIFKNKSGTICHTGIIEKATSATSIQTIEGNTSSSTTGSQDNGGCVARKTRTTAKSSMYFAYYLRPVDWDAIAREAEQKTAVIGNTNISDGAEGMFQYLKSIGYSDEAAAGVVGCFEPESSTVAKKVEWDTSKAFKSIAGSKEAGYDAIVNDRSGTNAFTQALFEQYKKQGISINQKAYLSDGSYYPGLGYAQWTGPRAKKLLDYASQNHMKWYEPALQLSYLDQELSGSYSGVKKDLDTITSAEAAARRFAKGFENGNMPEKDIQKRVDAAKQIYTKLKGKYKPGLDSQTPTDDTSTGQNDRGKQKEADILSQLNNPGDQFNPAGGPEEDSDSSVISDIQISKPEIKKNNIAVGGPEDDSYTSKTTYNRSSYQSRKKNLPAGGPEESVSSYKTPTFPTTPSTTSTNITTSTDLDGVINMLSRMLVTLEGIRSNTGDSNGLLSSLNEKEFVDQKARDTLSALGNVRSKKNPNYSSPSANSALSLAKP